MLHQLLTLLIARFERAPCCCILDCLGKVARKSVEIEFQAEAKCQALELWAMERSVQATDAVAAAASDLQLELAEIEAQNTEYAEELTRNAKVREQMESQVEVEAHASVSSRSTLWQAFLFILVACAELCIFRYCLCPFHLQAPMCSHASYAF